MTVIERDAVAADHLIYAWPQPIGAECDVSCGDDDAVIMCPAFLVGDRLGPGRHHWRTPDPSRPVAAYFVRSSPVEVPFDLSTTFLLPPLTPGAAPARTRILAKGAVQVRCADPALLVAQFVGLPFDGVNAGILRSVSRSVERMLARLLTRRVVIAGAPGAITDPTMLPQLTEELIAYNPAAGAVFGVELMRVLQLAVTADDGVAPSRSVNKTAEWGRVGRSTNGDNLITAAMHAVTRDSAQDLETTLRGVRAVPTTTSPTNTTETSVAAAPGAATDELPVAAPAAEAAAVTAAGAAAAAAAASPSPSPSPSPTLRHAAVPAPSSLRNTPPLGNPVVSASGEIVLRAIAAHDMHSQPVPVPVTQPTPQPLHKTTTLSGITPAPAATRKPVESPAADEVKPIPAGNATPLGHAAVDAAIASDGADRKAVSGEIPDKTPNGVAPGSRVRVPGPNGIVQTAVVRQLLQGFYELELGTSGETIWVPIAGVIPET